MSQTANVDSQKWEPLPKELKTTESIYGYRTTYWQDAYRRFKENKLAMGGVFIIILIILSSVFGPMLTGKDYSTQDLYMRNMPPRLELTMLPDGTEVYVHKELRVFMTDGNGLITEMVEPVTQSLADMQYTYEINGEEYILKFKNGVRLVTSDGTELTTSRRVWNKNYLLGTDSLGRDMLTRLLYGGRISLLVAFSTTCSLLIIGLLYGGIAGYYGGTKDIVMMRIVEILNSIPSMIYIILLMIYLGQGVMNILIAMAFTSWLGMARLVRGQVLSLKETEYILAAKSIGVPPMKIILRHLLPNCMGPVIVSATLSVPGAIATEAFMSFIGLGVAPPMPSWGILSSEGITTIRSAPYQILLPSIAISLTMFAFNFLGDGLRDALDPKLRK